MTSLANFLVSFFFSFIGTIPPGTLNVNILQLGLDNKIATAWRFALAAALVEYPYAWLAVKFESMIVATPGVTENIQLIAACVMSALGAFTLWSLRYPSQFATRFNQSGFRRGLLLSILNPLALPFWLGATAYLHSQRWILIDTPFRLHAYLFGVSSGALVLLIMIAYLARFVLPFVNRNERLFKIIPGVVLLVLGLYGFVQYFS
jgi:threonine/homoserine/homoserine lactone efflux protein